jgi:hypothetical protein
MSSTELSVSKLTLTGIADGKSMHGKARPAKPNDTAQAATEARKSAPSSLAAPPIAPELAILGGVCPGAGEAI